MDHPTRRLDPDEVPEPRTTEHPTRRLAAAAAPDQGAPQRLDAPAAASAPEQCPKCRGRMIWVRPVGRDTSRGFAGDLWLDHAHGAVRHGPMEARMCRVCGYTEVFAPVALLPGSPTQRLDSAVTSVRERIPCSQCHDQVLVDFAGQAANSGVGYKVRLDQSGGWINHTELEGLACPYCGRCVLFGAHPKELLNKDPPLAPPRPCPQCRQLLISVRYLDYHTGETIYVYLQKRIHAAWSGPKLSRLTAYTCPECGYTELYATEPGKLLEP